MLNTNPFLIRPPPRIMPHYRQNGNIHGVPSRRQFKPVLESCSRDERCIPSPSSGSNQKQMVDHHPSQSSDSSLLKSFPLAPRMGCIPLPPCPLLPLDDFEIVNFKSSCESSSFAPMDVDDGSSSPQLHPAMEIDYDDWNAPLLDCRCILSTLEDISDPFKC